jgi:hypothetical protein
MSMQVNMPGIVQLLNFVAEIEGKLQRRISAGQVDNKRIPLRHGFASSGSRSLKFYQ